MDKKFIFISYATDDDSLVVLINDLLKEIIAYFDIDNELDVFYAKESLRNSTLGSIEWKKNIHDCMEHSICCLPIFSKNSINNKWVHYELGLASANNVKIIPFATDDVNPRSTIVSEIQIRNLSRVNEVREALVLIFDGIIDAQQIKRCIPNVNNLIRNIGSTAKERCVYIVGSILAESSALNWEENVDFFVEGITNKLLEKGFKLASFPSVDHIGKKVAEIALKKNPDKYEIAGLYEFDQRMKETINEYDNGMAKWHDIVDKFRKTYLRGKDTIIIIGGGANTEDEFNTADTIGNILFLPIPCFGGFAKKLFEKRRKYFEDKNHPCCGCKNVQKCYMIDNIVNRIEKGSFVL